LAEARTTRMENDFMNAMLAEQPDLIRRSAARLLASRMRSAIAAIVFANGCMLALMLWSTSSSLSGMELGAFALLFATVTFMLYAHLFRENGVYDLGFPVALVAYIQSVVYPWYYFTGTKSQDCSLSNHPANYGIAIMIWMLAWACLMLGSTLAGRRGQKRGPLAYWLCVPDNSPVTISAVMIVISVIASSVMVFLRGGVSTLLDPNVAANSVAENRGMGVFQPFVWCSYVAVAYLGWQSVLNRRRTSWLIGWGLACCLLGSFYAILNARRGVLVYHVGILLLPWVLRVCGGSRLRYAIPPLLVAILLGDAFTSQLRKGYYTKGDLDLSYAASEFQSDTMMPMAHMQLPILAVLVAEAENGDFEFLGGETFWNGLLNVVPRSMFPGKGWTGGAILGAILTGGYHFDDSKPSSGAVPGILVEAFMNFGWLGSLIFSFGAGIALSGASPVLKRIALSGGFGLAIWSLCFFFAPLWLFADDFGALVTKTVCVCTGLVVLAFMRKFFARGSMAFLP
jgi:hypothetical protein